ncbi:MAG: hypothetical protein AB1792_00120 [Candidatus Zixiibacteriota bacterium]
MTTLLTTIIGAIQQFIAGLSGRWIEMNVWIESRYGAPVKWGIWILIAFGVLILLGRAAKAAVNLTFYVILPSAILTVLLLVLMPCWSPMKTFPILMGVTMFMLISRSR